MIVDGFSRSHEVLAVEHEARRFCDLKGITDFDEFQRICASMRHAAFLDSIQPFLKLKTSVAYTRIIDRIVMNADGSNVRVEYKPLLPETQKALDQLDEMIQDEARRWGFSEI